MNLILRFICWLFGHKISVWRLRQKCQRCGKTFDYS